MIGGAPGKFKNPEEAWKSGVKQCDGSTLNNVTFILSDNSIVGSRDFGEIRAPWYGRVAGWSSARLAMLAVADPGTHVFREYTNNKKRVVVLMTSAADDIYVLHVPRRGTYEMRSVLSHLNEEERARYLKQMKQKKGRKLNENLDAHVKRLVNSF